MTTQDPRQALAGIRERLIETRRQEEEQARLQAQREAAARRDAGVFRQAVGAVLPIAPTGRARVAPPPPPPRRLVQPADVTEVPAAGFSDGVDADSVTDGVESFARDGVPALTLRRLRRGDWPAEATLDLHSMNRDQARSELLAFLNRGYAAGLRCVRVVHGRGIGSTGGTPVLKTLSRRWLTQSGQVLAFAASRDGGDGAVLVLLRSRAPGRE